MNMQIDWREELDSSFGDGLRTGHRPTSSLRGVRRCASGVRRWARPLSPTARRRWDRWAAMPDDGTRRTAVGSPAAGDSGAAGTSADPRDSKAGTCEGWLVSQGATEVDIPWHGSRAVRARWDRSGGHRDPRDRSTTRRRQAALWPPSASPCKEGRGVWVLLDR